MRLFGMKQLLFIYSRWHPSPRKLQSQLSQLITTDVRTAIDPEKIVQYAEIRKNELYWRGNQYLAEIWTNGVLTDYRPMDGQWYQENPDADNGNGLYDTVINDVRGYGRKFIAVLAQQPPNVKAVPNDKQNDDHIRRAKKADRVAAKLHGLWKIKEQNRKLYLLYYKSGTTFGYTKFIANGEKYGYTEQDKIEMRPGPLGPATVNCVNCGTVTPVENTALAPTACPQCGAPFGPEDLREPEQGNIPTKTGTTKYENGCVEHRVESGLRVTTPFDIQELTDAPWLLYEYEEHKGRIFLLFPWLRNKMFSDSGDSYSGGGSSTTSGQLTRDIATSPSASIVSPRKNRLLLSQCWLRPAMYELARGDVSIPGENGEEAKSMELREALKKLYPTGLKVTQVNGDTIVKLEEERMDDVWVISPPEPAENAFPDPLVKDYIPMQDQTNDLANIQRQTWERAIPQLAFDTKRIDMVYQTKYRQLPASLIPMAGTGGGKLDDAFARIPVAVPEPQMEVFAVEQREHGAEIIGITKALYGAAAPQQTAYGTNVNRNQAQLQLSVPADAGREYWCGTTYNGVMLTAKYSKGKIPSPHAPNLESDEIEDIEELLQGGWHFEAAPQMPMSWSEQREQLNKNLETFAGSPEVLNMFGYGLASNIDEMQDRMISIEGWKLPNEDALNKVHAEIRELLKGAPTEQPSTQIPGKTIQIPSIPVDDFTDDHAFVAQVIKDWAQTETAMDIRRTNPQGYENVIAFGKAHAGLAAAAQQAQAMQAAGPAGPGGPPKPGEPPAPGVQKLMPPTGGDLPAASGIPAQQ